MTESDNAFSLAGRQALVTGGTQGVGAAIARAVARAGADVIVVGVRDDASAQEVLDDIRRHGRQGELLVADLSQPPQRYVDDILAAALDRFPDLGLLVNNVGTYIDRPFLEMDWSTYQTTMNLNVACGYFLTQAFARHWITKGIEGRVVFTGSINGMLAEADHTAYDTSKGAVAAMVRSLCVALAPHGIRVNSMAPGLVRTPLTGPALDQNRLQEWMELHTPNGRVPDADVCGDAVVFLLSHAARHVHGQTMLVDGGMSVWQQPDPPSQFG
ncbi:SDR family NAD(P)-dependent oxidoreductase [Crateriforma conspicua]|uniref:Gluconate 5-dehydrogenase n=2 Tax=Crateriforma conspicua TaxID=2527996 RepID=A0A5C5Y3S5_9PLAN|nr:SDR family oxidoreductase [Crateriforma conspicua]QDV64196.1 Gluconate 5-dehydrogenase [Crateriforma conspicua]TWT69588.1 Gluconate 5-dehydrogenase [Crateriforma conspicua]